MCRVGLRHATGTQGAEQSFEKAATWLSKAAGKGHAKAQYNLAALYHLGKAQPESPAQVSD